MASLGQHAVVGNGLGQLVAEKPAPGQIESRLLAELALTPDVEEVAEQMQLEDDDRIHGGLAGPTVVGSCQAAHELEIHAGDDLPEDVLARDGVIQREADIELRLGRLATHHGQAPVQ